MLRIIILMALLITHTCKAEYEMYAENIIFAANKIGVDPIVLTSIAETESNFRNINAIAGGTAGGIFQINDITWEYVVDKFEKELDFAGWEDKFNPHASAQVAAIYVRENSNKLKSLLGRSPVPGEIYLTHLLGPTGAKTILKSKGSKIAADVVPYAVAGNRRLFVTSSGKHRTVRQFKDYIYWEFNVVSSKYRDMPMSMEKVVAKHEL